MVIRFNRITNRIIISIIPFHIVDIFQFIWMNISAIVFFIDDRHQTDTNEILVYYIQVGWRDLEVRKSG